MAARVGGEFHPDFPSNGDVVLQSSEGTKFCLDSAVLKAASSVFRDMLAVPRDSNKPADAPVVLTESVKVLSFIFNCIFPTTATTHLQSYSEVWGVVDVVGKYDIPSVLKILRMFVLSVAQLRDNTLNLFAVASFCDWRDVVYSSSKSSLDADISAPQNIDILRRARPVDTFSLLELHWKRKDILKGAMDKGWLYRIVTTNAYRNTTCCTCASCGLPYDEDWRDIEETSDFRRRVDSYIDLCPRASDLWVSDFWKKTGGRIVTVVCSGCSLELFDISRVIGHLRRGIGNLPGAVGEAGGLVP